MNKTRFNLRCYIGMEWSGGDGGGDDNDDPNEVQLDDGDGGKDLPFLGRNFPDRFLPAGEIFSLAIFHPMDDSPCLRVMGGRITRRGTYRGGPGQQHHVAVRQEGGPRHHMVWAPGAPSA